jgi:uncharacterized protein
MGWSTGENPGDEGVAGVDYYELDASADDDLTLSLPTDPGNQGDPGIWQFFLRNGEVSDSDTAPSKPLHVVATAGDESATLTFDVPTTNGGLEITGYTATSTPGGIIATSTGTRIVVDGLTNGVEYTFTVVATNDSGDSSPSEPSNAVTPTETVRHHHSTSTPVAPKAEPNTLRFNIGVLDSFLKLGSQDEIQNPMDTAPVLLNDRTLLPIRFVVEPMGGKVLWDQQEQKITITKGTTTIELWIGSNIAKVNGVEKIIDPDNLNVKPMIVAPGRTMLPLRFISEALGCTIYWNQVTQEITVTNWV